MKVARLGTQGWFRLIGQQAYSHANLSSSLQMFMKSQRSRTKWNKKLTMPAMRVETFKFLCVRVTKDIHVPWSIHTSSVVKGTRTTPLPPQDAEKIWHEPSDPQKDIQLHH